jgi:hypothetical protein
LAYVSDDENGLGDLPITIANGSMSANMSPTTTGNSSTSKPGYREVNSVGGKGRLKKKTCLLQKNLDPKISLMESA